MSGAETTHARELPSFGSLHGVRITGFQSRPSIPLPLVHLLVCLHVRLTSRRHSGLDHSRGRKVRKLGRQPYLYKPEDGGGAFVPDNYLEEGFIPGNTRLTKSVGNSVTMPAI